jgi:hypothetical protein
MIKALCATCSAGPKGEAGHGALAFYVAGPYPGQQIFKCSACDGRWIRHYGSDVEPFAWTRYSDDFRTHGAQARGPKVKS